MDPLLEAFDPYVYHAQVVDITDGDTIEFLVDQGFRDRDVVKCRLLDVDTAETHFVEHDSDEYRRGVEHKMFVELWVEEAQREFDGDWPFVLDTQDETGSFGRWLGYVHRRSDGEELNQALLDEFGDDVQY